MAGWIISDGVMWLLRVYLVFYGGIALLIALSPIADLFQRVWSAIVGELSVGRPVEGCERHSRRYGLVPVPTVNRR